MKKVSCNMLLNSVFLGTLLVLISFVSVGCDSYGKKPEAKDKPNTFTAKGGKSSLFLIEYL